MNQSLNFEDMKLFFPHYLNTGAKENLFEELKQFKGLDYSKIYLDSKTIQESQFANNLLQSDGIKGIPVPTSNNVHSVSSLGDPPKLGVVMLLSNTCDMDTQNPRLIHPAITCVPVVALKRLKEVLLETYKDSQVQGFVETLKLQHFSNLMYLPGWQEQGESVVFFDRAFFCKQDIIDRANLEEVRTFSLSNAGFYLFLYKISIHFTRIREGVDRG